MKNITSFLLLIFLTFSGFSQEEYSTYCNPVNLDYAYRVDMDFDGISYRAGSDPAVVEFKDEYYLFATRSMGYWQSPDLVSWNFIEPEKWYLEGSSAPTAFNYKDSLLYVMGNPYGSMSIIFTDDPETGNWNAEPSIINGLKDPEFFIDDDGQAYLFQTRYNNPAVFGKKLDADKGFRPGEDVELFEVDPENFGWEEYEEDPDTDLQVQVNGPSIFKHQGKYYLQYGAPGTKPHLFADGAYISEEPLGPYEAMPGNPFSFKPGGFITGAGNGDIIEGPDNSFWNFASMVVNANKKKEQRIGMFPTSFDEDGHLHSNTYYGDYPHYAPNHQQQGEFTGWMLLSYKKPVEASSAFEDFQPENITDENIKTFWVAEENNEEQWLEIDLEEQVNIYAVQINFHDYEADIYGKKDDLKHQYNLEGSNDNQNWTIIADKSNNQEDVPHDYIELENPGNFRFIRYKNIEVPGSNLAISGLRVFGKAEGKTPKKVRRFSVERGGDTKEAFLSWKKQKNVQGYNVFWGVAPNKLYNSWMVYGENELELKSLTQDQTYYFAIEAFNENGISKRTKVEKVD